MRKLLFILCAFFALEASAQQNEELVYRLELGGGVGMNFNFTDVEDKSGVAAGLIARFPFNPRMALKTQLSYNTVKGSTTNMQAFYPSNPNGVSADRLNYSVSSAVYDLSALYELHFLPYGYRQDYRGHFRLVPYLQMGFGLAYGAAGKAFTANIPLGAGLKYKAGPRLNLGLDYQVHFSLSDKLDGLEAPLGIESSLFRNKDIYSSLMLTLTYDLNPKCPTCNRD